MKIKRSVDSLLDEAGILDWFGEVNVNAGMKFIAALDNTFDSIALLPDLGSPLEIDKPGLDGARFRQVRRFKNYFVIYRRANDHVRILRILRGSQAWDQVL